MPLREHDGHSNVSLRFLFNEEVVARPARSVVGSQPAAVRSFRNCLSYRDLSCLKPCLFLGWHIASERLLQEYTGLAISTQLRTNPKGYSHSKTPCGLSRGCRWSCITDWLLYSILFLAFPLHSYWAIGESLINILHAKLCLSLPSA